MIKEMKSYPKKDSSLKKEMSDEKESSNNDKEKKELVCLKCKHLRHIKYECLVGKLESLRSLYLDQVISMKNFLGFLNSMHSKKNLHFKTIIGFIMCK